MPRVSYKLYDKFASKIPAKSADFPANLSLKIPQNLTFISATYQKPCLNGIELIIGENALKQNEKKPRLKFNPKLGLISLRTTGPRS